jgi:hypothetical protein
MNHQCGKDIQDVSHPFAVAVAHDRGVEAEHLLGDLGKFGPGLRWSNIWWLKMI